MFLYVILALSFALNIVLLSRDPSQEPERSSSVETGETVAAVAETPDPQPEAVATDELPSVAGPGSDDASSAGWSVISGEVEHSLARTFQREAGEDGDALAGVYARLFVWDVDMRRDLRAGDAIAVVWRRASDGLPEIAAASLHSSRLGRTLTAYRWQAAGDPFPSYWYLDGSEVPLRLQDSPIVQYEQVTSLLKDRPTHKGMDFKTPVGTEVTSPRAGTVTRSNWNWKANGNCIEIRYDDGMVAKFLHLNENRVKPGDRVAAGQVIALTGNTGHSTAPHLHYQLDRGSKTIDPLDYHGTVRRSLDPEQTAALQGDAAGFQQMLDEADEG